MGAEIILPCAIKFTLDLTQDFGMPSDAVQTRGENFKQEMIRHHDPEQETFRKGAGLRFEFLVPK